MARRAEYFVQPARRYVRVAAGQVGSEVILPGGCRGLRVGVAGTLNVTMQDGTVCVGLPVFAGDNPGYFASIQTSTEQGAAENVWYLE